MFKREKAGTDLGHTHEIFGICPEEKLVGESEVFSPLDNYKEKEKSQQ